MTSPKREQYIRKVLDDWDEKQPFSAEKFASAYNERYGHYAIPSSGFFTYFLKFEKEGILKIIRSEEGRKHKYQKVW